MYMSGMGEVAASDILFTGSMAKPRNTSTLAIFKKLQLAANRFSKAVPFAPIKDDGDLGTKSTAAIKKAASYVAGYYGGAANIDIIRKAAQATGVKSYAYEADRLGNLLQGIANAMKMPDVYVGGDSAPEPKSYSSGKTPSIEDVLSPPGPSLSLPSSLSEAGLPLIAAGVLGLYLLMGRGKKSKGRKRGGTKRKSRARRRRR